MRDFVTTDQDAARDLVLAGLRDRWGAAYQEEGFNADLDNITASYIERDADVVVIEDSGQLAAIGMLVVADEPQGHGRIVRMSVFSSHQRQGLGRRIVEELLRRARERGLATVLVWTDTPWHSAVALYASCGFVETYQDAADTHFRLDL